MWDVVSNFYAEHALQNLYHHWYAKSQNHAWQNIDLCHKICLGGTENKFAAEASLLPPDVKLSAELSLDSAIYELMSSNLCQSYLGDSEALIHVDHQVKARKLPCT